MISTVSVCLANRNRIRQNYVQFFTNQPTDHSQGRVRPEKTNFKESTGADWRLERHFLFLICQHDRRGWLAVFLVCLAGWWLVAGSQFSSEIMMERRRVRPGLMIISTRASLHREPPSPSLRLPWQICRRRPSSLMLAVSLHLVPLLSSIRIV